jgi:hypothetical protein
LIIDKTVQQMTHDSSPWVPDCFKDSSFAFCT